VAVRLLFVTLGSPTPPTRGAQLRDFELIRRAGALHEVGVLALVGSAEEAEELGAMREHCAWTAALRLPRAPLAPGHVAAHLMRRWPLATLPWLSGAVGSGLRAAVRELAPDLVQIEHSFLAPLVDALVPGRPRSVLSLHNVASHQYRSMRTLATHAPDRALLELKARLVARLERRFACRFDRVIVVSEHERGLVLAADPTLRVSVVANGVDARALAPLTEEPGSRELLFVGNLAYRPNADAVRWLAEAILPRVRASLPGVCLRVVGRAPPPDLERLGERHGVALEGELPDLRPAYRRAFACVAPLRAGGGTRLKVLEAMAFGRPVVSTSVGCEGLPVSHGEHVLLADSPEDFAAWVVRLAGDPGLRARVCAAARRLVEERLDWDVQARALLQTHEEVVRG
jgi:glycosyltransferase involved in cell wall biosynthesis